jgi:hypothetical protein
MSNIRIFNRDFLVNELGLPYNSVEDKVIDNSRWSICHELIFAYDGKYYQTYYSVGSTECQDERPWEYEDEVECIEVIKQEVKVMAWIPVEAKEIL